MGAGDHAGAATTETEVDLRDAAQRDADALVELAARALSEGELPTEGGERPQVVVTVSLPVLQGRIGSASLALGDPVNADVARRIACDAGVIPAVLGARGEPLDIGRASRTVPAAIRRAVILRDGGCAFPGCSVPARWCGLIADHASISVIYLIMAYGTAAATLYAWSSPLRTTDEAAIIQLKNDAEHAS